MKLRGFPTPSRLRSSAGARSAALIGGSDGVRLVVQALFFLGLAATLGAEGFGIYAGTAALVGVVQRLGSWGTTDLLVKHVSLDRSSLSGWVGTTVATTIAASSVLAVVLILTAPLILGDSFEMALLLPLLFTDLLVLRIVELFWAAFLSVDRLGEAAAARLGWALVRIVALGAYVAFGAEATPAGWATFQAFFLSVLCIAYLVHLRTQLGSATYRGAFRRLPATEGLAFAAGSTSETVYGDADKALLLRYEGGATAGAYTAAYRLISFAIAPVHALVVTKLTSMYRAGHVSVVESLNVVRRYAGLLAVYSIAAGAGLVVLAVLLPSLIGDDYEDMAVMTLALAAMPLLQSSHQMLGAVLMTSGEVHSRGAAQVSMAALNIVLSLILISRFSWKGAVASSYASEVTLLAVYVLLIRRRRRREAWANTRKEPMI